MRQKQGNKRVNIINNKNLDDIRKTILSEAAELDSAEKKMEYLSTELHKTFEHYYWVGFYIPDGDAMTLGPSAGPPACSSIGYQGVCGAAFKSGKSLIVPDVGKFPGHIVCDPESKSEIVIPVKNSENAVFALLDVDSDRLDAFGEQDAEFLENLVSELFS
ncbi:MAG: GAF domain-containing protein [Candidatus Marinimicrobia bacterium]|nr:GAF domain-containing protein [Candidatus Neomarinimicrobiota bacterium]